MHKLHNVQTLTVIDGAQTHTHRRDGHAPVAPVPCACADRPRLAGASDV